jgi:hypothetical protein
MSEHISVSENENYAKQIEETFELLERYEKSILKKDRSLHFYEKSLVHRERELSQRETEIVQREKEWDLSRIGTKVRRFFPHTKKDRYGLMESL